MNVKPIPDVLLGDELTLLVPREGGWSEKYVGNVRVERTGAMADYSSQKTRDNTEITVWYDHANSYPEVSFSVGMRVRYRGEVFEIIEEKAYYADAPHHCKFRARKIYGEHTEVDN